MQPMTDVRPLLVRKWLVPAALALWPTAATAQVVEFYHLDALGSVRAVTNEQGGVVEQHDYLPFGEEWCGASGFCDPAAPGQPRRFTSKERDAETGLDYFGARYYGSRIGRFTTVDPVLRRRRASFNPQTWNRYSYAANNPLRYLDPDGRDIVLAKSLNDPKNAKDRAYVIKHLARLQATPAGRAMLERAERSRFVIEVNVAKLERTGPTPPPPGMFVFGTTSTHYTGGQTLYGHGSHNGHTILSAQGPNSPTAPPIQVVIDPANARDVGHDPALVFAHEFGGHTKDVLDAAESSDSQFIDSVNGDDETTSLAAEKSVTKLPKDPSAGDVAAVEGFVTRRDP